MSHRLGRFSVFVGTAVIGAAVAAVLFFFRDTIEERMAVRSLRRLGYNVKLSLPRIGEYEPILGSAGFLEMDGNRLFDGEAMDLVARFHSVRVLGLACKNIEPGVVRRLGKLQSLRILTICGADVEDRSLDGIGSAVGLETLQIHDTAIRGPVLAEVSSMNALRELLLEGNPQLRDFRAVDLRHLRNVALIDLRRTAIAGDCLGWIPNCKELWLQQTAAGDDTLRGLWRCTRLEKLELSNTRVTGQGIKGLASLPLLATLNLGSCPISDESLDYVQALKSLRALHLDGTPITDAGLERLSKAKQLKFVSVMSCPHVTPAGVASLRRSLVRASAKGDPEPEVWAGSMDGGPP